MKKIRVHNFAFSILNILYFVGAVLSVFICGFNRFNQLTCYSSIVCLPLCFLICFMIISGFNRNGSITINIVLFCAFLRYVVLPAFQSINPVYRFAKYECTDTALIDKSIFLMCYELLFISIFFAMYARTHKTAIKDFVSLAKNSGQSIERFPPKDNMYGAIILFCCFSVSLGFLNRNIFKQISFIVIKSNSGTRVGQISSNSTSLDMILRQIFVIGIFSLFVVFVTSLKRKLYNSRPRMAVNLSLLAALCCIGIIIAEQRSSQIYCAFASIVLLVQMFSEYKKRIFRVLIAGAAVVLAMLTIYKTFYAFRYGSYLDAISNSSSSMNDLVQTMEIYLLGPLSVSSAIKFGSAFGGISLSQLLYDICRSSIGLSFLVKSQDSVLTSASYNLFVTSGNHTSGFLLPITGQGYLTFGIIFSPVLICICFYAAFKLEKVMLTSKSAYVVYFSAYVFIRLATCMVSSNLNTVLNAATSILISAGVVYTIQWLLIKMAGTRKRYSDK